MRNEKLREVSVSYCLHADDYTVAMKTLGMKESNRDCESYGTIDLSFKVAIG